MPRKREREGKAYIAKTNDNDLHAGRISRQPITSG
jgi:hypothetical protein